MEENNDPRVIVLDRDVFERLASLARAGAFEGAGSCEDLLAHARRFNPHYAAEMARVRKVEEKVEKEHRQAARDLVSRKAGKVVYIRDGERHYIPGTLKGIGHNKTIVRIETSQECRDGSRIAEVFIGNVREDVPPDLVPIQRGYWRGFYADAQFEDRR